MKLTAVGAELKGLHRVGETDEVKDINSTFIWEVVVCKIEVHCDGRPARKAEEVVDWGPEVSGDLWGRERGTKENKRGLLTFRCG